MTCRPPWKNRKSANHGLIKAFFRPGWTITHIFWEAASICRRLNAGWWGPPPQKSSQWSNAAGIRPDFNKSSLFFGNLHGGRRRSLLPCDPTITESRSRRAQKDTRRKEKRPCDPTRQSARPGKAATTDPATDREPGTCFSHPITFHKAQNEGIIVKLQVNVHYALT